MNKERLIPVAISGIIGFVAGAIVTAELVITQPYYPNRFGMMNMMRGFNQQTTSVSEIQKEEQEGEKIYQDLQNNKVQCNTLKDDDFEKMGDYFMRQRVGSSENHANMDNMMEGMMGKKTNEQMHISLGKNASGCYATFPKTNGMMNFNGESSNNK